MDGEVRGVIVLEAVAHRLDAVTVVYTVIPARSAGIDFRIQHQLRHDEEGDGQRYPSVIVVMMGTPSCLKMGTGTPQFILHEVEHILAFRLFNVVLRGLGAGEDGYAPEEVEQIPIADGAERLDLGSVNDLYLGVEHVLMGLKLFDRAVAEGDDFIEIEPGIIEQGMTCVPGVAVEVLPDATVVPVDAACRQDGLVGAEGLQVVDAAAGALQSLTILTATNIVI